MRPEPLQELCGTLLSPQPPDIILSRGRPDTGAACGAPTRSISPMRAITAAILASYIALTAAPLTAQQRTAPPPDQARMHVVRPGDTLWDISRGCTGDPFLWAEIYRLNADQIRDPALIYPQQRLVLPVCGPAEELGVVRRLEISTGEDRIIATTLVEMPAIRPGDFFRAAVLAQDTEIPVIGRLVEKLTATVVPIEMSSLASLYDRVYVTLDAPITVRVGDPLHFYRRGREMQPYGRVYLSTGLATIEAIDGRVATAVMRTIYDAVDVGDVAVIPARFPATLAATAPAPLNAQIVGFQAPHPLQTTQEIVFLNQGRRAGVKEGDEFEAALAPRLTSWGTRPEIRVGRLQVVRVTDRTASARIVQMDQPAWAPGIPARRVLDMP